MPVASYITLEKARDFSCVLLPIPRGAVRRKIEAARLLIENADIPDAEIEDSPHVTALYGLHTKNASDIAPITRGHLPLSITVGRPAIFEQLEQDVLYLSVDSPAMHKLNGALSELPNSNEHPKYAPHITLAYLPKGEAARFVDEIGDALEGEKVELRRAVFSPPEGGGEKVDIRVRKRFVGVSKHGKHNQKSHGRGGRRSISTAGVASDSTITPSRVEPHTTKPRPASGDTPHDDGKKPFADATTQALPKITGERDLPEGVNTTKIANLDGRKGVYKPASGENGEYGDGRFPRRHTLQA